MILVVVMLAIACLIMTQVAILSMQRVREVQSRLRQRKTHWALVSTRQAVLGEAERIFAMERERTSLFDDQPTEPINRLSDSVEINGLKYQIELVDESAKLSIPAMIERRPTDVTRVINQLSNSSLLVRPDVVNALSSGPRWWDQVFLGSAGFSRASTGASTNSSGSSIPIGRLKSLGPLTLWGTGKINIATCSDEVLDTSWRALLGHFPPLALKEKRRAMSRLRLDEFRELFGLREEQVKVVTQNYSTASNCFSLLVQPETKGAAGWFFVRDHNNQCYGFELR